MFEPMKDRGLDGNRYQCMDGRLVETVYWERKGRISSLINFTDHIWIE